MIKNNGIVTNGDCNFGGIIGGDISIQPQQPQQDRDDVFFFGEFVYENLELFMQEFRATGDRVNLHITSNGGSVAILTSLLHIVNTSKKDIIIVVNGLVASCGFDFILKTNRKIVFTEIACGLVHDMDITCSLKELTKNTKSFDKFIADEVEKNNNQYYSLLSDKGFTEEEIDVVRKGEDLLVSRDRLLELFEDRIYDEENVAEDGFPYITEYEEEFTNHIVERLMEELDLRKKIKKK